MNKTYVRIQKRAVLHEFCADGVDSDVFGLLLRVLELLQISLKVLCARTMLTLIACAGDYVDYVSYDCACCLCVGSDCVDSDLVVFL